MIDFVKKVQTETGQASGQQRLRALCSTPPLLGYVEATASEPPSPREDDSSPRREMGGGGGRRATQVRHCRSDLLYLPTHAVGVAPGRGTTPALTDTSLVQTFTHEWGGGMLA